MSEVTVEKISLTQILAELKILDKRIEKKISESTFAEVLVGEKLVNKVTTETRTKEINSDFQSIKDLLDRRTTLKSKLTLANATTDVTIADKTMKVAEAIDLKTAIDLKKALINKLRKDFATASSKAEEQNRRCQQDVAQKEKEGSSKEFIEQIQKNFQGSVLNPLDIATKLNDLEQEVFTFESEVDFKLSEVNALTKVEV